MTTVSYKLCVQHWEMERFLYSTEQEKVAELFWNGSSFTSDFQHSIGGPVNLCYCVYLFWAWHTEVLKVANAVANKLGFYI